MGLRAGEVEMRGDDVSGVSAHIASRAQANAAPGQFLTTRTVVDLVAGSGLTSDDLERDVELKGVPGRVVDGDRCSRLAISRTPTS